MKGKSFLAFTALIFAGLVLLGGCSSPPPSGNAAPVRATAAGSLKVYTAQGWDAAGDGPHSWIHSDYKILGADQRLSMHVPNNARLDHGEPEVVAMPAGNYVVTAQARGRGRVSVPVKIEPGRMTVLRLDQPDSGSTPRKR